MVYSRFLCVFSLIFSVFLSACNKPDNTQSSPEADDAVYKAENVRIGYQRSSTLMTLLKESGELEKKLAEKNVKVSWHEFTSGQPLLEALNVGSVDVTADVADTVPVFAQAAQAKLTYYVKETASPNAQAILIPKNSKIQTIADLKGKKIAVTKAAGSHYLLIAALNQAGLSFKDITPAWLSPADGRAAFEHGGVDAWVTWEPYVSSGTVLQNAKVLASGEGLANYIRYYLTAQKFAQENPAILNTIIQTLEEKAAWVKANPNDAAKILAPLWGNLPTDVVLQANANRSYNVQNVIAEDMAEQQQISDAFFNEKLIPHSIDAKASDIFKAK
ncbi:MULTISPECIES: aliphatic sulfonate ABC transporter substrate-binding protein [unclassified Acinetobacter]|uniref:aliphatic sulfonate ABC transporter substrate-binding protein n=1 Tax=unclassified Acinetobacter TaxID=196816 RepID=UPI0007D059C3|nr:MULTISPECIES: aliphatic sulfonate ABC transporter substrate-binding protein [unclassified Acinetobacter]OAL80625.1 ABC transporter substrate-binding protein [Acinetobacter sp. SFA]OAL84540.1 ABC transporter substrate-binding protein [Acinetobacter sp. SFD]